MYAGSVVQTWTQTTPIRISIIQCPDEQAIVNHQQPAVDPAMSSLYVSSSILFHLLVIGNTFFTWWLFFRFRFFRSVCFFTHSFTSARYARCLISSISVKSPDNTAQIKMHKAPRLMNKATMNCIIVTSIIDVPFLLKKNFSNP